MRDFTVFCGQLIIPRFKKNFVVELCNLIVLCTHECEAGEHTQRSAHPSLCPLLLYQLSFVILSSSKTDRVRFLFSWRLSLEILSSYTPTEFASFNTHIVHFGRVLLCLILKTGAHMFSNVVSRVTFRGRS